MSGYFPGLLSWEAAETLMDPLSQPGREPVCRRKLSRDGREGRQASMKSDLVALNLHFRAQSPGSCSSAFNSRSQPSTPPTHTHTHKDQQIGSGSHESYDTTGGNSIERKETLLKSIGIFAFCPKISTAGMDGVNLKADYKSLQLYCSSIFSFMQNKLRLWTCSLTFTSQYM